MVTAMEDAVLKVAVLLLSWRLVVRYVLVVWKYKVGHQCREHTAHSGKLSLNYLHKFNRHAIALNVTRLVF
jgi:hypothetical protein